MATRSVELDLAAAKPRLIDFCGDPFLSLMAESFLLDRRVTADSHCLIDEDGSTAVLVGRFEPPMLGSLAGLQWQCTDHLADCLFVDDVAAQELISRLGANLAPLLGADVELVPLLRGGLSVASRLVYDHALADVTFTSGHNQRLRLVVDDVVLSGRRLIGTLSGLDATPTVVGLLHAHESVPELLIERFPHIVAVAIAAPIAARRVEPASSPDELLSGLFETPIYRWNEPECTFRNPETGDIEAGWKLMPGSACHANRMTPESGFVVKTAAAGGLITPSIGTILGSTAVTTVIARPSQSSGLTLRGEAHELFQSLNSSPSLDEACARMVGLYGGDGSGFDADLRAMLVSLAEAGFIG